MDFDRIREAARGYEKDMTAFLRAIVRHPGESCGERAHAETIAAEMRKLGFDEVKTDPQGNVMGFMGEGDKIIAFDGHIDTVGIGNPEKGTDEPHHSGRFQIDEDCLINSVAFYAQYALDFLNE